ncbi:MAG: asparagine synthetase B [Anaerolineaceae bacterium]|nr:MAG: asparagine synthetase B [Anaerolineaceae bacterium]
MCGIAGTLNLGSGPPVDPEMVYSMLEAIRHRGPDENGVFSNDRVGLGSARLSIIDLAGGRQPIHNEDATIWVVFNGEIYNYVELRRELESAGHVFSTQSDTEVLVHLYEEDEQGWLLQLNGQFAIALWDQKNQTLILARDRLGVRPIFYTLRESAFYFASEIKSLFTQPGIRTEFDPIALSQIFTFWTTLGKRTCYRNISSVLPGHYLKIRGGQMTEHPYWTLNMNPASDSPQPSLDKAAEHLLWLLKDAVRLRLRSDVPVGTYLSGGLDSSSITALASRHSETRLKTFSIAFGDQAFDESAYQQRTNEFLGVDNDAIHCSHVDIAAAFPEAIRHAEMPLLRTAPVPMLLLSRLVHEHNFKVVLTGEGADEILGGYDIFKEAKIRRFWARQPNSAFRPLLLRRLYPYISALSYGGDAYLRMFFGRNLSNTDDSFYAHRLRWQNTARCLRFFSPDYQNEIKGYDPLAELAESLPAEFKLWNPFSQAQYLEIIIFLSGYLLASQGDRMGMANSVEGRFPFLDPRVVDFSVRLPAEHKMYGLREKAVLKRAMKDQLPQETLRRSKQPYRAPIRSVFFGGDSLDYVSENLSPEKIRQTGYFAPESVAALIAKCQRGANVSETEEMALTGILSVQLLHYMWR